MVGLANFIPQVNPSKTDVATELSRSLIPDMMHPQSDGARTIQIEMGEPAPRPKGPTTNSNPMSARGVGLSTCPGKAQLTSIHASNSRNSSATSDRIRLYRQPCNVPPRTVQRPKLRHTSFMQVMSGICSIRCHSRCECWARCSLDVSGALRGLPCGA